MNRSDVETFIHANFGGIIQDWPWDDTPGYSVIRHADNKKWFILLAKVKYAVLIRQNPNLFSKVDPESEIEIINLKSDPDLIDDLIKEPGIISAYHMNKRHWITIPLNGTCPDERIKSLIDLSYQLTASKLPAPVS